MIIEFLNDAITNYVCDIITLSKKDRCFKNAKKKINALLNIMHRLENYGIHNLYLLYITFQVFFSCYKLCIQLKLML